MFKRLRPHSAATIPAAGISLLPNVICPACAPAYTALVSSLGLGFLASPRYLLLVTSVLLAVAVGSLFVGRTNTRGSAAFVIGLLAAPLILVGKFAADNSSITYFGVALLMIASVWTAIARRQAQRVCNSCLPADATASNKG